MMIYPSYIDSELSRGRGRKIAKKHAVQSPKMKEIEKALAALGIDSKMENESRHPRWPGGHVGRAVVDVKGGKKKLLKDVAKQIKRMRAPS